MNEKTKEIYNKLKKDSGKLPVIFLVLNIISFLSLILAAMTDVAFFKLFGMLFPGFLLIGGLYLFFRTIKNSKLKHSLKTLEATGNIKYISEILNKEYKTDGKICFSKNLLYIEYENVIAYKDILNIKPNNGNYIFTTIDGKNHEIYIEESTLSEFLNRQGHITYKAPRKEYKHKIEAFKASHRQNQIYP